MRRAIAASLPSPVAAATALTLLAGLASPRPLAAQAEFAVPVGAGVLRINIVPDWVQYDHFFAYHTAGFTDGAPVPLGHDFSADSLGVATFPFLGALQDQVRAATGLGSFSLNLGRVVTQLNASVRTVPIGIELGLSRRLSIGVTVPIVHTRVDVNFAVDSTRQGNAGWNPGFLVRDTIAGFGVQMDAALAALRSQADSGPAALRAQAQAVLAALQPFRPLADVPFLPRNNTEAGDSLTSRLSSAEAGYQQLAAQYDSVGIVLPALTATLALADTGLSRNDLETWISDPTQPLAADTIGTVVRTGIGDVTTNLTWQFADGERFRAQLVATGQLGTGRAPSASNFLDLGTGTHQAGASLALATDVFLGSGFLFHGVARAGRRFADQIPMRVTLAGFPFAPLSQQATVRRKPGAFVGLELAPVWMMDDAFSVRVTYSYFSQGPTEHSYVDPADEARIGLPASVLDDQTGARLMRIGGGVTFSTVARHAAGQASLPYSVTVGYQNTIWGRAGRVPEAGIFSILIRGYLKLF